MSSVVQSAGMCISPSRCQLAQSATQKNSCHNGRSFYMGSKYGG